MNPGVLSVSYNRVVFVAMALALVGGIASAVLLAAWALAELRVWLILFRDVRDGVARTGMTDIARRAGLTRRGVVKAVAGLKRRRLIEVVARGSVNGSPNVYRVHGAT